MNCPFCREEFEHTVVREYEHWTVQLFMNQYYLGRSLIKLNRHIEDFFELRQEERNELFEKVVPELKNALDDLFSPDMYNYCSLGNDCQHLHLHVIPRYSDPRSFEGQEFRDENWNSHYKPYPKDFEAGEDVFEALKSSLTDRLLV